MPARTPTLTSRAAFEALRSDHLQTRRSAAAYVTAHAGAFVPPVLGAAANELAREGRSEEAARWWLVGLLRLETEKVASEYPPSLQALERFSDAYVRDIGSPLHLALVQESADLNNWIAIAVTQDQRNPRLYPADWPAGRDQDEIPDFDFDASPNANADLSAFQARANEAVSEVMRDWRERHLAEEEIRAVISRGEAAPEAVGIIPSSMRERIRPLRTLNIGCVRTVAPKIDATPVGASPSAFLFACEEFEFDADVANGGLHIWIDGHSGDELSRTRFAEVTNGSRRFVVALDGRPFYPALGQSLSAIRLLGVDGQVSNVELPQWWNGRATIGRLSTSISGRWIEMHSGPPNGHVAVIDPRTRAVVWSRALRPPNEAPGEQFGGFVEIKGRESALVLHADAENAELVLEDVLDHSERRMTLPAGSILHPVLHDETHILVTGPRGSDAKLIDLETLTIVWRGENILQAPAPHWNAACKVGWRQTAENIAAQFYTVHLGRERFELGEPERTSVSACAVSADRSRLIVFAPPFAHLYEIAD